MVVPTATRFLRLFYLVQAEWVSAVVVAQPSETVPRFWGVVGDYPVCPPLSTPPTEAEKCPLSLKEARAF
jgi:hypothetical protein